MTENGKQEISLGAAFDAVVHYGDTTIELHPGGDLTVKTNGHATVYTDGDIDAYTTGAVTLHPAPIGSCKDIPRRSALSLSSCASSRAGASCDPQPGVRMDDGTVYAGISPDTHQPMYTTPADAPLTYIFNQARKYAERLDAHGHKDWRVPTKSELNVLWENRDKGALKDTFNVTGSGPAGWYWSSTGNYYGVAWGQRFSDGNQNWGSNGNDSSLRCVR